MSKDLSLHAFPRPQTTTSSSPTQSSSKASPLGDDLRYIGIATVVRDMDFMAQLSDGEGAKINYRGGSYGSILGAYLVNWPINWLACTEKTYRFYLKTCSHAGPEARIESFLDKLAVAPLPVPFAFRPGFLTSGAARALLLMYLERPPLCAESALALSQTMACNGTLLFNKLAAPLRSSNPHYDLARLGVTCLDSPPAPRSDKDILTQEDLAAEFMKTMREVVSVGEPDGGCQYWPVRGPERFTGPWNASLEWPLLIVSNTSMITPIESGLRINSLMPNSTRMIIQDGPGVRVAFPRFYGNYFATLPENGMMCETEYTFFPDPSEAEADSTFVGLNAEDAKLLDSVREVGEMLQDIRRG
ncbi:hypothetical protein DFH06DRAFT_1252907 [Mycena polygramma]|nr:hypothetical protein DFH06DRAFT_1252907 [Mycena polygramma]